MSQTIQLRGHHLLCLLGFRGMGYSPDFTINMKNVYEQLRQQPYTPITLVRGVDDLCKCYPSDKPNHCDTNSVHERDQVILDRLGLTTGTTLPWESILLLLKQHMAPTEIPILCSTCPWQPYGVCEEGLARISAGAGLAPL